MKKCITTVLFLFCTVCLLSGFKFEQNCNGCKEIEVLNKNGLYIFKIPFAGNYDIKPFVSEHLIYNKDVFDKTKAKLVINAGYFDTKNEQTTSYVVIDNNLALDPTLNENLINNKNLQPHLKEILNRTEFRVLNCDGGTRYDICAHNAKIPYKCQIKHSIQAGPLIYPDLRLRKEYFLTTKKHEVLRDSIQALQRRPRTAIGIKNNNIYLIIATLQHPLSLIEIQNLCSDLRLEKAMNFDGGGSTSVDYVGTDKTKKIHIVSEKDGTGRKIKSFLIVQ